MRWVNSLVVVAALTVSLVPDARARGGGGGHGGGGGGHGGVGGGHGGGFGGGGHGGGGVFSGGGGHGGWGGGGHAGGYWGGSGGARPVFASGFIAHAPGAAHWVPRGALPYPGGYVTGPGVIVVAPSSSDPPPAGQAQDLVVDDEWLRGALAWTAAADGATDCLQRVDDIARQGQRFLGIQAAWLISACTADADTMLRATALVAPFVVDRRDGAGAILGLFPMQSDRDRAAEILAGR